MQTISRFPVMPDSTYQILHEIGSGGGGIVYKAWHTRLKKHVVIKELKGGITADIETQRNEAEALKNVKSAYLPQVFDFLTVGDRVYTVMEFIEGESLDKHLKRGEKFSQSQVIKWYGQLAAALEAIHRHNVCHRDIKPANIMLTPDGDVCLIDFNAALVRGNDVTLISRSLGYASPEQYEIYEKHKKDNGEYYAQASSYYMGAAKNQYYKTEQDSFSAGDFTENLKDTEATWVLSERNSEDTTSILYDDKTEKLEYGWVRTKEEVKERDENDKYSEISKGTRIDWKRSDIYSLGATIYHLLTGVRPSEKASDLKPIRKIGHFSEGIIHIVERSMQIEPVNRFGSVTQLSNAIHEIHKYDARWRTYRTKQLVAAIVLPAVFAASTIMMLAGYGIMRQEKEERYYNAVYRIENSEEPQIAYQEAIAEFDNRIDAYRAMAIRLWNEGDLAGCRTYIEQNLGNIAEFQNDEPSWRSLGDIYNILGNCGYYQQGEPDYDMAEKYFEIALTYATDNPSYYRDYAIALVRTGNILRAEEVLILAQQIGLDNNSITLLQGEIAFEKKEYSAALDSFEKLMNSAEDDNLRYRAYYSAAEVYETLGQHENSIKILTKALNDVPLNRAAQIKEKLANAYVKTGNSEAAIALFEELAQSSVPQFHIMQNLAILLHNNEYYSEAQSILTQMKEAFPKEYRVPMRLAYLEADLQSTYENEKRDYTQTKRYYDEALALYEQHQNAGNDPEMQQLELIIKQLYENGWLN